MLNDCVCDGWRTIQPLIGWRGCPGRGGRKWSSKTETIDNLKIVGNVIAAAGNAVNGSVLLRINTARK